LKLRCCIYMHSDSDVLVDVDSDGAVQLQSYTTNNVVLRTDCRQGRRTTGNNVSVKNSFPPPRERDVTLLVGRQTALQGLLTISSRRAKNHQSAAVVVLSCSTNISVRFLTAKRLLLYYDRTFGPPLYLPSLAWNSFPCRRRFTGWVGL